MGSDSSPSPPIISCRQNPPHPKTRAAQPKPCSLCLAISTDQARTSPQNAHVSPPYQMFLTPAKTLSDRSWCLMPNNEAAGGPTTKIVVEPLFRIRPQTFAHVDHQRAPVSSPSHPFHVMMYCAFYNASASPPRHVFPCFCFNVLPCHVPCCAFSSMLLCVLVLPY